MDTTQQVDTKKITRRPLRFERIDDAIIDAEKLVAAERLGKTRQLGNWTLGQILGHLGTWAGYSFTGTPIKPPLVIRLILRPMKKRFLYKSMRRGVKIPKIPGGTLGIEPLSLDEGLKSFRDSYARFKTETPTLPHPIFGPMTHDEWVQGHLRHAELHLSFISIVE